MNGSEFPQSHRKTDCLAARIQIAIWIRFGHVQKLQIRPSRLTPVYLKMSLVYTEKYRLLLIERGTPKVHLQWADVQRTNPRPFGIQKKPVAHRERYHRQSKQASGRLQ